MKPVFALVGRPNVGKSTLFNRLTKSRDALVADFPGLTRDRKYGQGVLGNTEDEGRSYLVIDTGGLSGEDVGIDEYMANQTWLAVDEANTVLFMVDGREGLTTADHLVADRLRRAGKSVYLVVNKTDTVDPEQAKADFYQLGFKDDERTYEIVDFIFDYLNIKQINLLTNNPDKLNNLKVEIVNRIPIQVGLTEENSDYMKVKKEKMDHILDVEK